MLYGTAEFRKNFYIKLRQMTGIIFRAPGRIDATRVHARASAKRATGSGVRFGSKADICSATAHVRFAPKSGHVQRTRHVRFVPQADIHPSTAKIFL